MTIFNEFWHKKLESAQYNAALAITGAVPGINTIKLYQELRLESLQNRRKLRRLSLNYKLYNEQSPLYLYNLIPSRKSGNYPLRNVKEIPTIKVIHWFFENSFFTATITEWNDLDNSLRDAPSNNVFKQNILKFIRLGPNKGFNEFASWLQSFTRSQILIIISVIVLIKFMSVENYLFHPPMFRIS